MTGTDFVQPIAAHTGNTSYLILRDTNDKWFLWVGSDRQGLTEIPESTVRWMRQRPEIEDLPLPRLWFEATSLPLAEPTFITRHL